MFCLHGDLDLWHTTLTLNHVTFDLDPWPLCHMSNTLCKFFCHLDVNLWPKFKLKSNGSRDMYFYLVNFLSNYFLVTDRQTGWQMDRQKATHKSPPCTSTGGLNNMAFFGMISRHYSTDLNVPEFIPSTLYVWMCTWTSNCTDIIFHFI